MAENVTKIAVVECGGELYVRVQVFDGDHLVGEARLEGGDLENATGMAQGLVAWIECGGDITAMLPMEDDQ